MWYTNSQGEEIYLHGSIHHNVDRVHSGTPCGNRFEDLKQTNPFPVSHAFIRAKAGVCFRSFAVI